MIMSELPPQNFTLFNLNLKQQIMLVTFSQFSTMPSG